MGSEKPEDRLRRVLIPILLYPVLASLIPAFGGESGNTAARPAYAAVAAALTQFIQQELAQKQLPALSIALVDGHEIVWAQGFGYADPAKRIPASAETVYRVGSVSMLFTDIGVMQLVERGRLDLDGPIEKVLPDFHPQNPFGRPITLRELMSHRSGLLYLPPEGNTFDPASLPLADVVHSLNNNELVYPPGTHTKYSNAGVTVAGYALERAAGEPLAAYLKRAVLYPAGMRGSSFEPSREIARNLAKGFMWTYDGRVFSAPTFEVGIFPATGMYTTVADLGRFIAVLFDGGRGPGGQVIKPETLRAMWGREPGEGSALRFGIGFELSSLDGHRMAGHDGDIYGFATSLETLPDDRLGAVAVTTLDSSTGVTDRIIHEALRLMLAVRSHKPLPKIPVTAPVAPDLARRLDGRYGTSSDATVMDLTERNGRLYLLPSWGGIEIELRRQGNSLIVDDRLAYGRKFPLQEDADKVRLGGLERIDFPKPPPAPSQWAGLIGEYGWDHNILYILEKDGKLTALTEWFEYCPLTRDSENIFCFPDFCRPEKATFQRGAQGYATQVSLDGVVFKRRPLAGEMGPIFRINPLKPVEELRHAALAAQPPRESGEFLKPDLVELVKLDPTIKLDIRYASTRNFLSTPMYQQARALLQRPAAEALARANRKLKTFGYGLLVFDAYRPWYVTKMFWDATPEQDHIFVANPREGSRHNRGCAVDVTLYDLQTGEPAPMVGGYDEMSERSYPFYPGGTSLQRWDRRLLRHTLEAEGFTVNDFEWWHFDYKGWRKYPILNLDFKEIGSRD